jgi:hypothetical protein
LIDEKSNHNKGTIYNSALSLRAIPLKEKTSENSLVMPLAMRRESNARHGCRKTQSSIPHLDTAAIEGLRCSISSEISRGNQRAKEFTAGNEISVDFP